MNAPPRWVLRVASKPSVGAGHIRRSLALADALQRKATVTFALDGGGERWIAELKRRGFASGVDDGSSGDRLNGCVLDGYDFAPQEVRHWRNRARFLAHFDDSESVDLMNSDLVIAAGVPRPAAAPTATLSSLEFALVDRRYAEAPLCPVRERVERLLLSFGYRDSANASAFALRALAGCSAHVTLVLGADAPHLDECAKLVAAVGGTLRTDVSDMLPLLQTSDLVIGGGGVSLLERLACGVPSVTLVCADNQWPQARAAAAVGATRLLGDLRTCDALALSAIVEELRSDRAGRLALSRNARTAVDGRGAERLAEALLTAAAGTSLETWPQ